MSDDRKPDKVKVSKTTGRKLRAIGSETTDAERRAALDKVAEALREKNEGGGPAHT